MKNRLIWKLTLGFAGLAALGLVLLDIYFTQLILRSAVERAGNELRSQTQLALLEMPPEDSGGTATWVRRVAPAAGARVTVIAWDGTVIADSQEDASRMENHAGRPEIAEARRLGEGRSTRYSETVRREMVYYARVVAGDPRRRVLRLAAPLAQVESTTAEVRRNLWLGSGAALLLGLVLAYWAARGLSRRVQQLADFSARLASGNFEPLTYAGPADELAGLARSMNRTAAELEDNFRQLQQERSRLESIVRSMVEGVAVVDASQRVLYCNEAFLKAVGRQGAAHQGVALLELVRNPDLVKAAGEALTTGRSVMGETRHAEAAPGGASRIYRVSCAPVLPGADKGTPGGAVVVLHDITEIRRLESVRRDFVANVSHELRTPLASILGFAETLLAGADQDPENRRRFLEIIRGQAEQMSRLSSDLLDLARIQSGQEAPEKTAVRLEEVLREAAAAFEARANSKNLCLEVGVAQEPRQALAGNSLPAGVVMADRRRLLQVVSNLLDNAIRYTPPGGRVAASLRFVAEADLPPAVEPARAFRAGSLPCIWAWVSITDSGPGIAAEDLPRIFERFYRADKSRTRSTADAESGEGGAGLGLAIARHLVEAHGGRIWAESPPGQGARFHCVLPAAACS